MDAPWFVEGLPYNPFGFDLGEGEVLGPYVLLKACVGGKRSAVVENIAPTDQDELVTISIQGKDSKESRFRIWASKNWNYLPREYSYHTGKDSRVFVIKTLEAVKSPGGHWFPTKVLRISSPDKANSKSAVLLVAKSIKFDVADTELDGVFEVEAGTQFNVSGKPHFFVSSQAETVSLANLGGIYQKAVAGGIRQKLLEQGAKAP